MRGRQAMGDPLKDLLITLTTRVRGFPSGVDARREQEASGLSALDFALAKVDELPGLFHMEEVADSLTSILMTELPNPLDTIHFLSKDDDVDYAKASLFMKDLYASLSRLETFKDEALKFLRVAKQLKVCIDLYRSHMTEFFKEALSPSESKSVCKAFDRVLDDFLALANPRMADVQKLVTDDLAQKQRVLLRAESSLRLLVNVHNSDVERRLSTPRTSQPYSFHR